MSMVRYHAAWVLPISSPPIRDGWVAVDRRRIVAVGHRSAALDRMREIDLGGAALLPGLVNAHTHLELSYLHGQVPAASNFVTWVRGVIDLRRKHPDPRSAEIVGALDRAIEQALACGTALVGDISNTLVAVGPLERSRLSGVVFYELIRFNPSDAEALVERAVREIEALQPGERIRVSLAAHAPYSVAPLVFRAIRRALDRNPFAPLSVHLSESAEEVEFVRSGTGAWRDLLEQVGSWDNAWVPPGVSPVRFLEQSGFLDGRVLAVHGVQMGADDLAVLAARGTTLVACPRSNAHTGAGTPPIGAFYRSGVRVAVGTDSLASTPDLNVFSEIAAMRRIAPDVPARAFLESATLNGARALGFDAQYGSIEPGKDARVIAVTVPPGTGDVEEYLVSGVGPEQVRWLEDSGGMPS